MNAAPRVALFADCFHEVNGVARTCRQLAAFARRRGHRLLSVHAGPTTELTEDGSVSTLELRRSPVAIPVDADFSFDLLFHRYAKRVAAAMEQFRPELVHITGPGDVGVMGAVMAHRMGIPLVASWHTNIHQFAARRVAGISRFLPAGMIERNVFRLATQYYRVARHIFAPNPELVALMAARTGRPCSLMRRGVDTALFSPEKRAGADGVFTLGYVGRLTPEKNVRMLAGLERALLLAHAPAFRILVVGQGGERGWLASNMRHASLPGVLKGEELARAYASMDAFVFPSETDTYGNVIQEAMASGVPCLVSPSGGPGFLVRDGETGFVCPSLPSFVTAVLRLMRDADLLRTMRCLARDEACGMSWDRVFEDLYREYGQAIRVPARSRQAGGQLSWRAGFRRAQTNSRGFV